MDLKGGLLLKRKDYLGVDEEAGSHPNRTYYFKKNSDDLNKTIAACSQTLRNEPHNTESLALRGSTLLKMERFDEAVADFTALVHLNAASVEIFYKRGVAYSRLDAHDAAIAEFSRVLEMKPDHVNASFARAACYNTIGQFSNAIEDYNMALLQDQSAVTSGRTTTPISKSGGHHSQNSSSGSQHRPQSQQKRRGEDNRHGLGQGTHSPAAELVTPTNIRETNPSSRKVRPQEALGSFGERGLNGHDHAPLGSPSLGGGSRGVSGGVAATRREMDTNFMSSPPSRVRPESEDDNSTVISGITFMSNTKGYMDSPGETGFSYLPLSSDEYHQKGYEFRRQGKFESAIEEYSKALQKDPRHFKALFNRAFAMDKLGEYKNAIQDYSRALDVDPSNAYAYYNRGISHDRKKNYLEASTDFKHAIKLSPNNLDFLHNLALCLRKMGHTDEALETYSQCLKLDATHVKARHGRAMCNETLHRFDRALQDYDAILAQNPQHMLCMVSRAHLLHRMSCRENETTASHPSRDGGRSTPDYSQEAYLSFSASLDILCPDVQMLINSVGNHSSSVSATGSVSSQANSHINRCTESISILFARAKILEDRGNNEGAINDLTSAIHLASALVKVQENNFLIPKSSTNSVGVDMQDHPCLSLYLLFYNRALGWKACDQYSNAMTDLTTTLKLIIDERNVLISARDVESRERLEVLNNALNNAYNHRGFCFRKVGKFDEAISDYTNAIRALPDNARALNNRAYCYAKKDMYAEAVADYTRVIEIDPFNSHSYHNRGISLDKLGRADDALADFAKVIELDSSARPSSSNDHIDISSSFRERYVPQDSKPVTQSPSTLQRQMPLPPPPATSPSARDMRYSPSQQDPSRVATDASVPVSDSSHHSTSTSVSTLTRKPRRPPPSRPTKPPSPGQSLTQKYTPRDSVGVENHRQRDSAGLGNDSNDSSNHRHAGRPQLSPPTAALDALATSFGRQSVKEDRSTASRTFEPIRMSTRVSSAKKTRKSPELANSAQIQVQNSYNSRSFVRSGNDFRKKN